jgi:hypothetical protein
VKLRQIAGNPCPDGRTCPAVHESDRQTLVIVGSVVTDPDTLAQLAIGPGEMAIEVPAELLPEVARA